MIDFEGFNSQLLAQVESLLPEWLPGGRFDHGEYKCSDISGGGGGSLCVDLKTGRWLDFGNDAHKGGDLVSLYATIHGLEQRVAALSLGAEDKPNGNGAHLPTRIRPDELPDEPYHTAEFKHSKHGIPSQFWVYRSAAGAPLFVVARYDTDKGKEIVPWTWARRWTAKGYAKPRPLYGLERLAAIDGPILIVEGEKTADAAQQIFPNNPCLTWCGGASAVKTADWSPIAVRQVILWPDNDAPGKAAMATVGALMLEAGCSVQIVDPSGWPEGWDVADALPADDVSAYAESHLKPIEKPAAVTPTARVTRLQTTTAPGNVTVPATPLPGSLDELYARYGFNRKPSGRPYANQFNISCAIAARTAIAPMGLYYDEFSQRVMVAHDDGDREWDEGMNLQFTNWLQNDLEMYEVGPRTVRDGVNAYCFAHPRDPPREWLESLKFDGEARLKHLLPCGFGTERDEYAEAVGRCFIVGMVARVLSPGCQVDAMPVFEGAQGDGKTRALRIIGGPYFAEVHDSIMSKDFCIALQGKMLCEISELGAFKTAEIERIKAIITTTIDRYRAPYASTATDHPRRGVFSGTTNRDDWNTDDTGARRFWPVSCGEIDFDWLTENRQQLFAEAVERFKDGEPWWNVPAEAADERRAARQDIDPWEAILAPYLRAHPAVRIPHLLQEVLQLKVDRLDHAAQRRVGRILRKNKYKNTVRRYGADVIREWVRSGS